MAFQIIATAPTSYQISSLRAFNLDTKKNGNGSFTGTLLFDSEDLAKDHLKKRAKMYNDEDSNGTEEALTEMHESINVFGTLTLDTVTAHIEEIE